LVYFVQVGDKKVVVSLWGFSITRYSSFSTGFIFIIFFGCLRTYISFERSFRSGVYGLTIAAVTLAPKRFFLLSLLLVRAFSLQLGGNIVL
jgi:hypothetical protein